MLHAIGKNARSEELVELLLACHGRIRTFIDLAVMIGEGTDAPDESVVDASARVQRYFSEALPLHMEDEEEGVLPRLYGRSAELDGALERMREEHDLHGGCVRRLLALCTSLRATPSDASARVALATTAEQLRAAFEPHLEAEERIVFPAIRNLLSITEQQAMVLELRARRQPP